MDTSSGDSTEKPKLIAQRPVVRCAPFCGAGFASARQFEKVDSFAFKKVETFIILCIALAIGASEAAAMAATQVPENRQILEESRQIRQNDGDSEVEETPGGTENRAVAGDEAVTNGGMTQIPNELPRNLRVPENMRPMLMRMLQTSATFRRQIAVLTAKPAVRMTVTYGGMRGDRNYHALSTVRKHEWGAMLVDTTVYVPTDLVEIIAHELEHVCEQMEGVDLPSLSRRRGVGVYNLNGHYETVRAIRAGQNASREYNDGSDSLQQTIVRAAY